MPSGPPRLTALSHLGLAKETTYGTAVTATTFLPVKNQNIRDEVTYLRDEGMRGSPAVDYGEYQGVMMSEIEWEGDFYSQDTDHLIMALMGTDGVTGAGDPWSHAFTLSASQPPSYTFVDTAAAQIARQYPGGVMTQLDVMFQANGSLTYRAHASGLKSSTVAIPTQSFDATPFFQGWQGAITLNASAIAAFEGMTLTFSRAVVPIYTAAGSQSPNRVFVGPLDVSGSGTFYWDADTDTVSHYLAGDVLNANISFDRGVSPTRKIQFQMTQCVMTHAVLTRGNIYVEAAVDFHAVANSTDGSSSVLSPIKVTSQNGRSTAF
jgi:Phage tail tube protein